MSEKSVSEILQEIRDYRNGELARIKDNRVFYTMVSKMPKGEKTGKTFYRIIEEYSVDENKSKVRELFYEYTNGEPRLVAVLEDGIYVDAIGGEEKILTAEEVKEKALVSEDILAGRKEALEQAKKQAQSLGLDDNKIENYTELELYKTISDKIEERNLKARSTLPPDDKKQQVEQNGANIPKNQAEQRGIVGMNQIPLDQKLGLHGQTLRDEIGLDSEKYKDIVALEIVPTYKLAFLGESVNKNPFSVVGRKANGEVVVFPENVCRAYRGSNNEITKLNERDESVTRKVSDCIFEFPGREASLVIDQESTYGIVGASLAYSARDNDGRVATELTNSYEDGTYSSQAEVSELVVEHRALGSDFARKMQDEAKSHPDSELKNGDLKPEDADGLKHTASHNHKDVNSQDFLEAVQEVMDILGLEREDSRDEIIADLTAKVKEGLTLDNAVIAIVDEKTLEYEEARGVREGARIRK